jgi:hypothetical protein
VMPSGDVDGCDTGLAPSRGEVIQIDPAPVCAVEESP